jgi:hypothetical protein
MDHLTPELETTLAALARLKAGDLDNSFPRTVADALNILRHEKIGRWESNAWVWAEDPDYDQTAKKVAEGYADRKKQDALYVRLSSLVRC